MSDKTKEGTQNKKVIVVSAVAVMIIIVLIGIIVFMMRKDDKTEDKRPVVVTEDNMDEILEKDEPDAEVPLSYQVTMNSTWEFENGKAASEDAYVANSENNETAVYFDVIRNDTQEVIYQSPVIPRGEHLDNIVLDKDLDAGDYECTMTYHLIDDDQNTLTTVNMWLMVKVAN